MVFPNIGGGYTTGSTGYDIGGNDPFSNPNLPPLEQEPLDTNWPIKWTFNGKGFAAYGVPKETFYLAYKGANISDNFAQLSWKLYRETRTGSVTIQQTVTSFQIIGYTTLSSSLEQAKLRLKFGW